LFFYGQVNQAGKSRHAVPQNRSQNAQKKKANITNNNKLQASYGKNEMSLVSGEGTSQAAR
jgi:hypothetical protein